MTRFTRAALFLALVGCGSTADVPQPPAPEQTDMGKSARREEVTAAILGHAFWKQPMTAQKLGRLVNKATDPAAPTLISIDENGAVWDTSEYGVPAKRSARNVEIVPDPDADVVLDTLKSKLDRYVVKELFRDD